MTNIVKRNDEVLVLLGEEVTSDGLSDFIAKIKTLVGKVDQVSIINLKELKKCTYNSIYKTSCTHTSTHQHCIHT